MKKEERDVGDGGEIRCGDLLPSGARRLCGPCAQVWAEQRGNEPAGCCCLLERVSHS